MLFLNIMHNTIQSFRYVKTFNIINLNITRTYTRWVSRKPIAIVNEDELYECNDTTIKSEISRQRRISTRKSKRTKLSHETKSKEIEITERKNKFTKLKENDKIVTYVIYFPL